MKITLVFLYHYNFIENYQTIARSENYKKIVKLVDEILVRLEKNEIQVNFYHLKNLKRVSRIFLDSLGFNSG
jgi:hypothetical protein